MQTSTKQISMCQGRDMHVFGKQIFQQGEQKPLKRLRGLQKIIRCFHRKQSCFACVWEDPTSVAQEGLAMRVSR